MALQAVSWPTAASRQIVLIDGLQVGSSRFARIASTRPTPRIPGLVLELLTRVSNQRQFIASHGVCYDFAVAARDAFGNPSASDPAGYFVSDIALRHLANRGLLGFSDPLFDGLAAVTDLPT